MLGLPFNRKPKMEQKQDIVVDEVERFEKDKLVHLISQVFHLAYADLCGDLVFAEVRKRCYGCEIQHPSQRHHDCCMLTEQESWDLYYLEVKDEIKSNKVWEIAAGVCHMLGIPLHRSWAVYISELHKLPQTTVFLLHSQFEQYQETSSTIDSILEMVNNEPRLSKFNPEIFCGTVSFPTDLLREEHEQ